VIKIFYLSAIFANQMFFIASLPVQFKAIFMVLPQFRHFYPQTERLKHEGLKLGRRIIRICPAISRLILKAAEKKSSGLKFEICGTCMYIEH
jgi:hypothetical protein